MTVPTSLLDPALTPVFEAIQRHLERYGVDSRRRVQVSELSNRGRELLGQLLDSPLLRGPISSVMRVDLADLEVRLTRLGLGDSLERSLALLGYPVSLDPSFRRDERRARALAREAIRQQLDAAPTSTWTVLWFDECFRAGVLSNYTPSQLGDVVTAVLDIITYIDDNRAIPSLALSRGDVAAHVLGDAHALDRGTPMENLVRRALASRDPALRELRDPQIWESVGVQLNGVSGPALTWGLVPQGSSPLATLCHEALRLCIPLHLSSYTLSRYPLVVASGTVILVTENPRIVECAVEKASPVGVVSTNGYPSRAVVLLLEQLYRSHAQLLYHGDFDSEGLRICAQMYERGLAPWKMDCASYRRAVDDAAEHGVILPRDSADPPPTPWDPPLQELFAATRQIIHEERLQQELLSAAVDRPL